MMRLALITHRGIGAKLACALGCALLISTLLSGCGHLNRALSRSTAEGTSGNERLTSIRAHALEEIATRYGAQTGLAQRAVVINQVLEKHANILDRVFNFRALLLNHNLLPPVLVEGQNELHVDNEATIRLADHMYRIVKPARFVTTPPSWRAYLALNYEQPSKPDVTLRPHTRDERRIWDEYLNLGWRHGAQQADLMLAENIGRLKRDYTGMVLYSHLLAKHMISPPYVAKAKLGITGDAHSLRINDQVLRITAPSALQPNANDWQAALRHAEHK